MVARPGVQDARPEGQRWFVLAGERVLVFAEGFGILIAAGRRQLLHQRVIGQDQIQNLVGLGLQGPLAEEEVQWGGVAVMGKLEDAFIHRVDYQFGGLFSAVMYLQIVAGLHFFGHVERDLLLISLAGNGERNHPVAKRAHIDFPRVQRADEGHR